VQHIADCLRLKLALDAGADLSTVQLSHPLSAFDDMLDDLRSEPLEAIMEAMAAAAAEESEATAAAAAEAAAAEAAEAVAAAAGAAATDGGSGTGHHPPLEHPQLPGEGLEEAEQQSGPAAPAAAAAAPAPPLIAVKREGGGSEQTEVAMLETAAEPAARQQEQPPSPKQQEQEQQQGQQAKTVTPPRGQGAKWVAKGAGGPAARAAARATPGAAAGAALRAAKPARLPVPNEKRDELLARRLQQELVAADRYASRQRRSAAPAEGTLEVGELYGNPALRQLIWQSEPFAGCRMHPQRLPTCSRACLLDLA
jgi:hypothetical protein